MVSFLLAAALAATGPIVLTDRAAVVLDDRAIRVADVADGVAGSWLARVEIARMPPARRALTLSRRALASLIRRAAPGLSVDPRGSGTIAFRVIARPTPTQDRCWRTTTAVAAGATIDRAGVTRVTCDGAAIATRYDHRDGVIVATASLPSGSMIGPVLPLPAPAIVRGDAMTLVVRAGVVTVERPVVALQPGRVGHRVFVRDGAGQVSSESVAEQSR